MSLPNTPLAYAAEFEYFDKALADPLGARVHAGTRDQALNLRFRLNAARRIDREKLKESLKRGDPAWGTSPFDAIVCRLKQDTEDEWWVYLERNDVGVRHVESLSGEGASG